MRYSQLTGSFYPDDIYYPNLPADLINVPQEDYIAATTRNHGETLDVVGRKVVVVPAPMPTTAQVLAAAAADMTTAVQGHMDAQAQAHGYDNLLSAISYADESAVSAYQADGLAFRSYRSKVWAKCHELLGQVQAGTLPIPTIPDLLAMLPKVAL